MRVGDSLRRIVADRANEQCEYCQYPEQFSPSSFEVEHIVPKAAGGLMIDEEFTRIDKIVL